MGFSDRLKSLRTERNLSQEELAKALNINRTSIAHYERSDNERIPRPDTLNKIADFFNVSIDYLMDRSDDRGVSSNEERFLADAETLSLSELQKKYQLTIDGEPATKEELAAAINLIRSLREQD